MFHIKFGTNRSNAKNFEKFFTKSNSFDSQLREYTNYESVSCNFAATFYAETRVTNVFCLSLQSWCATIFLIEKLGTITRAASLSL